MQVKKIILETAAISAVALLIAFTVNTLSPRGIPLVGQWNVEKGVVDAGGKQSVVSGKREIELPEAQALFEQGTLFVDARGMDEYNTGHIKNAESLPVSDFYARIADFKKAHPDPGLLIVAYCNGRECTDSHELAENMKEIGYTNVKVFIDGFPAWETEKLPIEK
ncbi:MAG: rhodanese-like domain-containing protein [Fibrobacterota bacterium]